MIAKGWKKTRFLRAIESQFQIEAMEANLLASLFCNIGEEVEDQPIHVGEDLDGEEPMTSIIEDCVHMTKPTLK
jgi:hypothetical protein